MDPKVFYGGTKEDYLNLIHHGFYLCDFECAHRRSQRSVASGENIRLRSNMLIVFV
jgi:hypothetical protein